MHVQFFLVGVDFFLMLVSPLLSNSTGRQAKKQVKLLQPESKQYVHYYIQTASKTEPIKDKEPANINQDGNGIERRRQNRMHSMQCQ